MGSVYVIKNPAGKIEDFYLPQRSEKMAWHYLLVRENRPYDELVNKGYTCHEMVLVQKDKYEELFALAAMQHPD